MTRRDPPPPDIGGITRQGFEVEPRWLGIAAAILILVAVSLFVLGQSK